MVAQLIEPALKRVQRPRLSVPADPDRTIPVGGLGVTAAVRRRMIKDHAW